MTSGNKLASVKQLKPEDFGSQALVMVEVDRTGAIIDPNFNEAERVEKLYQQDDLGKVIPFDASARNSNPVFGLIPVNKKGELISNKVSQPQRESVLNIILLADDFKLVSAQKADTFAKIETDMSGQIVDPNFNKADRIEHLFQEEADGTVVEFDSMNPLAGPVFGLVPSNKDG